ncbi:MAG: hypothetical protein AB7D36_11555 [Oscillospiraceae bacterium]
MKIIEAIEACKKLKDSAFDESVILDWLSRLDGRVSAELIKPDAPRAAYAYPADLQTELLIPHPYDEAYLHYIEAMADYSNEEYDKYQNSYAMFNNLYSNFRRAYNRTKLPQARDLTNVL